MAERGRFELPISCDMHPFQGCALGHYATSPEKKSNLEVETRLFRNYLERAMGLEPTTAAMARRYSSQLSYARTQNILSIFGKMQLKNPRKVGFLVIYHIISA